MDGNRTTELWARNPNLYIRECVATGVTRIAWSSGVLIKRRIDPHSHASTWFPNRDWQVMVVGDIGAQLITPEFPSATPKAVYPVWRHGAQSLDRLIGLMREKHDPRQSSKTNVPRYRQRPNQDHVVVVNDLPNLTTKLGQSFAALLAELQDENPQCKVYVHGLYSWPWIIGGHFAAADFEARIPAASGNVLLPSGRLIHHTKLEPHTKWVHMLGWTLPELEVPANRCKFIIESHRWGAENAHTDLMDINTVPRKKVSNSDFADILNGRSIEMAKTATPIRPLAAPVRSGERLPGDRFFCDACSYANNCRAYRKGSICAVPDSESDELAQHFKTRNSDLIIEGLGKLMQGQLSRLAEGQAQEKISGELDPHVTKMSDGLFKQGIQLAKLVDPSLRSAAIAVNVGANSASVQVGSGQQESTHQLASRAIARLEAGGVPRNHITEDLVRKAMLADDMDELIRTEAARFELEEFIDVDEVE